MTPTARNRRSELGNLLPIGAMCLLWIVPMIRFWGAVFGPLRPYAYSVALVTPSLFWFVMGAVVCFVPLLFPRTYFRCWESAHGLRVYESAGVRLFKRYATNGDLINRWVRRLDTTYRLVTDKRSAQEWAEKTRRGERSHLILLLMGSLTAAYAAHIGWEGWAVGLAASNIIFNGYPILLQRYNRCRIERLLTYWPSRGDRGGC